MDRKPPIRQSEQPTEKTTLKTDMWHSLTGLWSSLTEPNLSEGDPTALQKSLLLSSILVVTIPVAILGMVSRLWIQPSSLPVFQFMMGTILLFLVPYFLARQGHWRLGTFTYLILTQALITFSMVTDTTSITRFHSPLIVVLIAALLLEIKDTSIIVI